MVVFQSKFSKICSSLPKICLVLLVLMNFGVCFNDLFLDLFVASQLYGHGKGSRDAIGR